MSRDFAVVLVTQSGPDDVLPSYLNKVLEYRGQKRLPGRLPGGDFNGGNPLDPPPITDGDDPGSFAPPPGGTDNDSDGGDDAGESDVQALGLEIKEHLTLYVVREILNTDQLESLLENGIAYRGNDGTIFVPVVPIPNNPAPGMKEGPPDFFWGAFQYTPARTITSIRAGFSSTAPAHSRFERFFRGRLPQQAEWHRDMYHSGIYDTDLPRVDIWDSTLYFGGKGAGIIGLGAGALAAAIPTAGGSVTAFGYFVLGTAAFYEFDQAQAGIREIATGESTETFGAWVFGSLFDAAFGKDSFAGDVAANGYDWAGVIGIFKNLPGMIRKLGKNAAAPGIGAVSDTVGVADSALPGKVGFWKRWSIIRKAEREFGATPKIRYGQLKDEFIPDTNTINLSGSRFGKHRRGTFFEEIQHAIDDVLGHTPKSLPKPGTLENALFHQQVFGRLVNNPIFDLIPSEKRALMAEIYRLVLQLGGFRR